MPTVPDDADLTIGPARADSRASGPQRFAPGSIIAGRYRLIALLGKGGMGEVYRAEDLTLDQQVALKFLPERGDRDDPAALAQFHNELRMARQVSHRNVCRLHDLGEFAGRRFLTMEYVDGEDLASLVRRIGRVPQDKAAEIARQICAGLAAAHDRGVVHRDLKPANVMLDGDGNVRITDFGLAAAGDDASADLAGTPQYMAPEQFDGRPATVKSDIYALGLVLFEIFTGRRAVDAKTLHEVREMHGSGRIAAPSSIVRELDPAVERVIQRCLDRDPARRPASALSVAAALPGGNPLAEALAAGETPSPELLSAAAERDALPVWQGVGAVVAIVAGLLAAAAVAPLVTFARLVPLDKPPAVLADRAEQILGAVGYGGARGDTADGFQLLSDYIDWIARRDPSPGRWRQLASGTPPGLIYWYRTSPRDLVPRVLTMRPSPNDPPPNDTGMHTIVLDTRGRLLQLNSVPAQFDPDPAPERDAPWTALFDAAGLPMRSFSPTAPQWIPHDFADARLAWEGPLPDAPAVRMRVEAASYRGRPVSFALIGPWTRPARMQPLARSRIDRVTAVALTIATIGLTLVAALIARHNFRQRRADAAAATRLAIAAFAVEIVMWIVGFHHVSDVRAEVGSLTAVVSDAGFVALALWINYIAFEPYCRRFWPNMLLGWSRLLSGHIRDPRVGRDLLVGIGAGVAWLLLDFGRRLAPMALGHPPVLARLGGELTFTANADAVRLWAILFDRALMPTFSTVMLLVLLRLVTKRPAAATAIATVAVYVWWSSFAGAPVLWLEAVAEALIVGLFLFVMIRFGLLAALAAYFVWSVGETVPLTLDVRHWSAAASNQTIALLVALTLFGFYASRAGKPLFGRLHLS